MWPTPMRLHSPSNIQNQIVCPFRDCNPQTLNLVENNAVEIGYSANDNYPIPRPAINLGWKALSRQQGSSSQVSMIESQASLTL